MAKIILRMSDEKLAELIEQFVPSGDLWVTIQGYAGAQVEFSAQIHIPHQTDEPNPTTP